MDEDLKFGIGLTTFICGIGWLIGGINALIPCIVFCAIPIVSEIKERLNNEHLELETCQLCGSKFKIRNKVMEWEYRTVGLCPACLDSIFRCSKTIPKME